MVSYRNKKKLGEVAETVAAEYLKKQGFTIEKQNLHWHRAEIDIIARKDQLLIFVEVKMRNSTNFGYPETFVTPTQQELYHQAATAYIEAIGWSFSIRFDIIALHSLRGSLELTHFKDAF